MNGNECVSVSSDQFLKMRTDADKILQKLVKNMIEKDSEEGELTIKIAVKFIPEYVDNGPGKTARKALKPSYEHKVSSTMKIQDSEAGKSFDDMKEVVFDEETGQYVTRYIRGAEQMNIFDYEQQKDQSKSDQVHNAIEDDGHLLPGPTNLIEEKEDSYENEGLIEPEKAEAFSEAEKGIIDAEYREVDKNIEEDPENARESESELQNKDSEEDDRFLEEYEKFESYRYEEPEDSPEPEEE